MTALATLQPSALPIRDQSGLRAALADANLPTLLMVYATYTQDRAYLDSFAPYLTAAYTAEAPTNVPEAMARDLRDRLFALLTQPVPPREKPVDREFLCHMMGVSVGEKVDPGLIPVLYDQMGFEQPAPRKDLPGRRMPPADFDVLVIGGGMSGIAAGIKLSEAGYSYTIVEKNEELGGTWYENRYPGVGVDTPSHFYSYSFELNPEWSHYHPKGPEIQRYLLGVADRHGVRSNVLFNTRVTGAVWDESAAKWHVKLAHKDGTTSEKAVSAVLLAHGVLNRWSMPKIAGLETFKGPMMHTAGWDPKVDLKGKRVAVIGTGASAAQLVPAIADEVAQLTVFQRSKHWVLNNPDINVNVNDNVRFALRNIPHYKEWFRFRVYWFTGDGLYGNVRMEADWPNKDVSISAQNDAVRNYALHYIHTKLANRPDLVETLEASGGDLQHAVQKLAVPEATERGYSVHELIRVYNGLIERAIERLNRDHKRGALIDLKREPFAKAAERALKDPDPSYLLGSGVAGALAEATSWSDKVVRLLDMADAAPASGPARTLALSVIEKPIAEILTGKAGLADLIGRDLDVGGELAALTRLVAADAVELLTRHDPKVGQVMPPLGDAALRLGKWLGAEAFEEVRTGLGKRILRELNGPRRLRPSDAIAEIDILRALAMSLTAAAGRLLPLEEVQSAFSARSRMLVTGDFVGAYLGTGRTAFEEAKALVWLTENVIGAANKRNASKWLSGCVSALRFETEMKSGAETPAARLGLLAALQRQVGRCGLAAEDSTTIQSRLGDLGGALEADTRLTASLAQAKAPPVHRLTLLLRLAAGEAAPLGPAADRARAEALKLVRLPETRTALAQSPEQVEAVRALLQNAGLAA